MKAGNPQETPMVLDLFPAYGRAYATLPEALDDWQQGLDFQIHRGPYTSSRDSAQIICLGVHRVRFWSGTRPLGEHELNPADTENHARAHAAALARDLAHLASLGTVGAALTVASLGV
jgi:hypothetical protein